MVFLFEYFDDVIKINICCNSHKPAWVDYYLP